VGEGKEFSAVVVRGAIGDPGLFPYQLKRSTKSREMIKRWSQRNSSG